MPLSHLREMSPTFKVAQEIAGEKSLKAVEFKKTNGSAIENDQLDLTFRGG